MPKTQSKTKFQSTFGKREQGILKGPEGCLNDEGPQFNDNVADNFKESENVTVNSNHVDCMLLDLLDSINLSGLWTLEP